MDCNACGSAAININNFTSRATMEANGWHFSWSSSFSFLTLPNSQFCGGVATTSYCGFQSPGDALLSLTLVGSGSGTLDFGNSWTGGSVWAYLNGELLESAEPTNLSVVVNFTFGYGDVLTLSEFPAAAMVINRLTFACSLDRPRRWLTARTAANLRICDDVTVCSITQYQLSAATPTSDTVCMPITSCLPGLQHQTSAATATTDTVCTAISLDETMAPTASTLTLTGSSLSTSTLTTPEHSAVQVRFESACVVDLWTATDRPVKA
jgi:hypothetical protein